jgi:hypothetical protein
MVKIVEEDVLLDSNVLMGFVVNWNKLQENRVPVINFVGHVYVEYIVLVMSKLVRPIQVV